MCLATKCNRSWAIDEINVVLFGFYIGFLDFLTCYIENDSSMVHVLIKVYITNCLYKYKYIYIFSILIPSICQAFNLIKMSTYFLIARSSQIFQCTLFKLS